MASSGKIAWVTGGSVGIGEAIARELIDAGYTTVISARDEAQLAQTVKRIGNNCEGYANDVTDRAGVDALARRILERHGRIDVLVNNAGHNSRLRKWDELVPEEFDGVIAANITGTFNCIHAVLPAMRAQHGGIIVNVSSVAGKQVNPDGGVAYTIAKHGAHIMAKMLNQTELQHGIRACVVAPAGVATRAHDWRPKELLAYMLRAEDVARAVRFAVEQPPYSAVFEIELGWSPA